MKIIVASKNPVKVACTKQAFEMCFPGKEIEYTAVETASDVSEQPLGQEETLRGAINRARSASNPAADFSVGIEGGVSFLQADDGRQHNIEICWVCVYDCKNEKYEIASSPGFPVLPNIVQRLHEGQNLSQAMASEYGLKDLDKKNGYIGWLTNDALTRQSSNYEAVLLALCALIKEES